MTILLKCILKHVVGRCGPDSSGSEYGPLAGFCKYIIKLFGFRRSRAFLD